MKTPLSGRTATPICPAIRGPSFHGPRCRALVAAVLLAAAPGRTALAETLYEALAAAYAGNPGLDAERERQRADEELSRQAIAGWLPKVSLDAQRGHERTRTGSPPAVAETKPQGYGVTVKQPLFSGFRTYNGKRKADAEVRAGWFQFADKEQSTLLEAVTAYVDVRRDRRIRALRGDNVRYLENELKASSARFRGGELSRTDVAQARTRLHEGKADLVQAEADLTASEARYEAVVGHLPGELSQPTIPERLLPVSLEAAYAAADLANPELGSARQLQEAARRAKLQAYGEFLPEVSLELQQDNTFDNLGSISHEEDTSIYLRLDMPLFAGTRRSKVRQTSAQESQRQLEVADLRRRTHAEVTDAWKRTEAAKARIEAAKFQTAAAREALKGVKIETDVGERAYFELLDAQREVVNAEVALERAKRDFFVASYSLLAAAGTLRAHLLGLDRVAQQQDSRQQVQPPVDRASVSGRPAGTPVVLRGGIFE